MNRACDACTEKCEKHHGEQRRAPIHRFVKFMLCEDHKKRMYLPPDFARRVKLLANQETEIEDSNGVRWCVTLSKDKDSLAFGKGWEQFCRDHCLKEGYVLVFSYIMGSHFTVHIFSRSACERTNFSYEKSRLSKRHRRDKGASSEDKSYQAARVNSNVNPVSASGNEFQNPMANLVAENAYAIKASGNLSLMIPDFTKKARELQQMLNQMVGPLHAEIEHEVNLGNTSGANINFSCDGVLRPANSVGDDIPLEQAKTTAKDAEMAVDVTDTITNNSTKKSEKALGGQTAPMAPHSSQGGGLVKTVLEKPLDPHSSQGGGLVKTVLEKPLDNSKLKVDMLNNVSNLQHGKSGLFSASSSIGTKKIAEREPTMKIKFANSMSSSAVKNPIGGCAIKKEVEMDDNYNASAFHQLSQRGNEPATMQNQDERRNPVVKVESNLSYETGQLVDINPLSTMSVEVKSQSSLVLPLPIDIAASRWKYRKQLILYLRDSAQKLWPVVYLQYRDGGALTVNWTGICKRNNIKPGDECRFEVEDLLSGIYKVDVTCRSASFPIPQLS